MSDGLPPHAPDVERAIVGAMLIDREAADIALSLLSPEDFYHTSHRMVFCAVGDLLRGEEVADVVTVVNHLKGNGGLEKVGGPAALAALTMEVATGANVEYHARIVLEKSRLRKMLTLSSQLMARCREEEDSGEVAGWAMKTLTSLLGQANGERAFRRLSEVLREVMEGPEPDLLPTGFTDLDRILGGGLRRADLSILAARPSMGKTALALSIAHSVALQGRGVAFFSLEMSDRGLARRFAQMVGWRREAGLIWQTFSPSDGAKGASAIWVDPSTSQTLATLKARLMQLRAREEIGLVVLDYLQLLSSERASEDTERETALASKGLKALAREFDLPFLVLSQLSRAPESRNAHRPRLSDLRYSGAIEQDADVVLFIFRPEIYGIAEDKEGNGTGGVAEVMVAKQRNGPVGTVRLAFLKERVRFENMERFKRETL